MVKTFKIFSNRTNSPMFMKLGMEQYVLKLCKVYINDDPELTLTHFKTMSNFAKLVFVLTVVTDISGAFTGPLVLWFQFLTGNKFALIHFSMMRMCKR